MVKHMQQDLIDRCAIVIIIALVDWHKLGRRRFLPAEKKREERRERVTCRVRDGRTSADKWSEDRAAEVAQGLRDEMRST